MAPPGPTDALHALIEEIRIVSRRVSEWRERLAGPHGLTPAERQVLAIVVREGAATVPQIAKMQAVSRQHIQMLADALVARGLAGYRANPDHKRSQLLEPSIRGEEVFTRIDVAEERDLEAVAAALDDNGLRLATEALRALGAELDRTA